MTRNQEIRKALGLIQQCYDAAVAARDEPAMHRLSDALNLTRSCLRFKEDALADPSVPTGSGEYFDGAIAAMHCGLEYLPDGQMTNALYVLIRPKPLVPDESGEHPGEQFMEITLTRQDAQRMMDWLNRDWLSTISVCGDPNQVLAPFSAAKEARTTLAMLEVVEERYRQQDVEGWTPEHDDSHGDGSMAQAAAVYCVCDEGPPKPGVASQLYQQRRYDFNILNAIWPRGWQFWPKDRRRNLVRAGALILAEIERLDRAAAKSAIPQAKGS
jgi:hypothetical protein